MKQDHYIRHFTLQSTKVPLYKVDALNLLMQDLGTLDTPAQNSRAHGMNDQAWVVGSSTMSSGPNQAFLWRDGVMTNLNDLIPANSLWVLTNAVGINALNEIVGNGLYNGQKRAFILRQGGRISRIDSLMVTNGIQITTNEFEVVDTQQLWRVGTQVIEWVGVWGTNADVPKGFTVEHCDHLQDHNWVAFDPTSQWPITETYWTHTDFITNRMGYFRVRAAELAP